MDPTWRATDSDDWEHILRPGPPENGISFFDLMYDHIATETPNDTDVQNSSQTRDMIHDLGYRSEIVALPGAPVGASTETDVKSSVSRTHFEETKNLGRRRYEEPLTTIDTGLEQPQKLDAAYHFNPDGLSSSPPWTVISSAGKMSPLQRNTDPPQPHAGVFDADLITSDSRDSRLFAHHKRVVEKGSQSVQAKPLQAVLHGAEAKHINKQRKKAIPSKEIDQLDDSYYVRSSSFFQIGKVFTVLSSEPVGRHATATSTMAPGKHVTTGLLKRQSDHVIPGILDSQYSIDAIGDTGAKYNFLNEDYAKRCMFKIDSTSRRPITIASGQKIMTTGVAEVYFCFRGERTPYPLKFHILPGCIKNVILGKSFLKATKTFSNALHFAKRVVKRITRKLNTHEVLFLGASPPMFAGLLNGETKTALADSASKVLIMDEDYARTLGLSIVSTKKTCIKLRFADGSTAFTSGKTYNVSWQFGTGKRYPLDFYILKDAPADVILSEDFLLRETKAFIEYADCLMEEEGDENLGYYDENDDDDYCFAIDRDENYHPQAYTEGADQYFEDDREDFRRTEEDLYIGSLFGDEKDAAIAKAKERREQWAAKQAAIRLAQGNRPSTINTASSSAPPQSHTSNAGRVSSTSKRQIWRFKLKKKCKSGQTGQNP